MFESLKIQNASNFHFEKRAAKKQKVFIFLKGHYFVMAGPTYSNVCVF